MRSRDNKLCESGEGQRERLGQWLESGEKLRKKLERS